MKHKNICLTLLLSAVFTVTAIAQTRFQKSYDHSFFEQILAVEVLANGHLVLAGFTNWDPGGLKHTWVMRVTPVGDIVWTKTFMLSQSSSVTAIQKTTDGNLLLTYNTYGSSITDNASGWMKLSTDGAVIWSKKAIGNSSLTNISPSVNGGYLLCGESYSGGGAQITGLVVRIGEDGEIQWSSVFGENGSSAVTDCWEDAAGLIHCCGYTSETAGDRNGFWAKLAPNGDLVGPVRRYGSSEEDELIRIVPMGADRLLLSGYSRGFSNSAYSSVWTVVTDYSGDLKSSRIFSLAEQNLITNDMIALPGDQYLLAMGVLTGPLSPAILTKLSIDLDQLFSYQYKGGSESDAFVQVIKTSTGFAATGATYTNGDANGYLVTTDIDGKLESDDCCPMPLEITRQDVSPETVSFVPTQTAFYAVQNVVFNVGDLTVTPINLCQPILLDFTISEDTICPGECILITSADSTAGVIYTYEIQGGTMNPDKPDEVCHTEGPALFITRKGMNANCEKSLTKKVALGTKKDEFPNAFTPNGDNANDVFKPVFGCPALTMHFQIYNRWGAKVYETFDPTAGWDGKVEGEDAASDVYVWVLEYEVENNGAREKLMEKGEVTLLR